LTRTTSGDERVLEVNKLSCNDDEDEANMSLTSEDVCDSAGPGVALVSVGDDADAAMPYAAADDRVMRGCIPAVIRLGGSLTPLVDP
jgi:hypothetical protein